MADSKISADEKLDAIAGHLTSLHEKHDASNKRLDAMSENFGTLAGRMDALEAEKQKAKADAQSAAAAEVADAEAKTGTEEDREKFAAAQMRCDAAYQAWGKQAPHGLHGENLRDYKIRLLGPLKRHSKVYADSALSLVGDDAAFAVIQDSIIADAIKASNESYPPSTMRKVVSRMDSGHIVTKFIGDPRVGWAEFSGGATKFGRINTTLGRHRS